MKKTGISKLIIVTDGITTKEINCIDTIVSDWKRSGVDLDQAICMAQSSAEKSEYYDMDSDWNEDTIRYMIVNWDSI